MEFVRPAALAALVACVLLASPSRSQCADWSPDFALPGAGMEDAVLDLALFDDGTGLAIYATGSFKEAGGLPVGYIARWDGAQWWPLGSGLNSGGTTLAVHSQGGGPPSLYVGGYFTMAGGQPANRVARWDGTSWHAVGGGIESGVVHTLCSFDDGSGPKLYAGGGFGYIGGIYVDRIAAWDGLAWTQVGDGFDGDVIDLCVYDEGAGPVLMAGGWMHSSGSTQLHGLARWSGGAWSDVGGGVSGGVASLTVYDLGLGAGPQLWVGGTFDYAGGVAHRNFAAWDGSAWSGPATTPDGQVDGLIGFDDGFLPALVASGNFTNVGSLTANHIAAWNGSSWYALSTGLYAYSPWNPNKALLPVLEPAGPRLYVGGDFDTAGGKESLNIARWNEPCSGPVITLQPHDQTAVFPEPITFRVKAHGTAQVQYQWRHDGVPMADLVNFIEGSQTDTVTIYTWSYSDHGLYDCEITNPLATVYSHKAMLTVPAGGVSGNPIEVDVVLYPPAPTANVPGSEFTRFTHALQSSTDEVLFRGELDGYRDCLARWTSGPSEVLAKTGDDAPGLPVGYTLGAPTGGGPSIDEDFAIGPNGTTAFLSGIKGPGVTLIDDQGIWYHDGTMTRLVVREGDQAVGMPAGAQLRFRDRTNPRMSENGQVIYWAETYQQGTYYGPGVWLWDASGTTTLLADNHSTAPGTSASFVSFWSSEPLLTPSGSAVFFGLLDSTTGWNYSGYTDTGLWYGTPGALQLVARSGEPAPGFPAGTNLEMFLPNSAVVDGSGRVAFTTFVAGPGGFRKHALYQWHQGVLTPIALEDQQAPGADPGSTFFTFNPMAMEASGILVFESDLRTTCPQGCPKAGVWAITGDTIIPVMLYGGEPLPGYPGGFELGAVSDVAVNDLGQVAFSCVVSGPGFAHSGVFGWSKDKGIYPIVVPGTQIELDPDLYGTVRGAGLDPVANGFGNSPNLSPAGLITFGITFTDWSTAIAQGSIALFESLHFGSGEAYCFGDGSGTPCPCGNLGPAGSGCANSAGTGALLGCSGPVRVPEDALEFHVSGLPPYSFMVLYQGTDQAASGLGVPFGDGLRCAGGTTRRLGIRVSNLYGVVGYGPGLAGIGHWQAGETWHFQAWYRDPGGPCGSGSNMSNATSVTFLP